MTKNIASTVGFACIAVGLITGCSSNRPVAMAPPISAPPPSTPSNGEVYQWQDVPKTQEIGITRAVFDQGGYQLYAATGETIVVPFANQNMYVMKFGKSAGSSMYFVNDGVSPTLYVPNGASLENAAAQGAKWFPFPQNYVYSRPVYMGLAPTWGDYAAMAWYPGMMFYGGYYGYRPWMPGLMYSPMMGLNINIGGRPYYGWNSYSTYYRSNPGGRMNWSSRPGYNYASAGRRTGGSAGSASGSRGSFGTSSAGSARSSAGGSFGRSGSGAASTSGARASSGGSFGRASSGASGSSGFGSGSSTRSGSFGASGSSGFGSTRAPFGGGASSSRPSGGSFGRSGTGSAPAPAAPKSSGGFFGRMFGGGSSSSSTRSSGGFFGGGSSSSRSSGGFFGGGGRSGGFGGRRR